MIYRNVDWRGPWHATAMAKLLTAREVGILALLAKGKAIREIADAFGIAERSVRAPSRKAARTEQKPVHWYVP